MEVITQETLYMKNMVLLWSTSVENRIVALPLFWGPSFFSLAFLFFLGQYSMNDDHHTSIYLQLNDYNSILEQGMTLYECLWRCTGMVQWIKSDMYENYESGLDTNTMSTTWSCKEQYDKSNACHMNGTVESCMEIYLGMAMDMP